MSWIMTIPLLNLPNMMHPFLPWMTSDALMIMSSFTTDNDGAGSIYFFNTKWSLGLFYEIYSLHISGIVKLHKSDISNDHLHKSRHHHFMMLHYSDKIISIQH